MYIRLTLILFLSLFFTACEKEEVKLPDKCYKKGKTGMCRGYFIKYNYNLEKGKCEKYVYGGCGDVVFHTLDKCKSTCEK